jgi:hypothetical protein
MKDRIRVLSPAGFIHEFETPEFKDRHELLAALPLFEDELLEAGYTPAPAAAVAPPAPQPAPTANGSASFLVDSITATVSDGKAFWRVKGGEFQKWGVIVYDEVLQAAGLGELNPLKPHSEPGMVAWYSLKPDGKPKKVTRLERSVK